MLPTLDDIKRDLGIPVVVVEDDDRLLAYLAAAVEVIEHEVRSEFLPLSINAGPAMRVALIEFVRDMWASSGPRSDTVNDEGQPVYGLGRPLLPPYVRALLTPYMPAAAAAPLGAFPPAYVWPDQPATVAWLGQPYSSPASSGGSSAGY